MGAGFALYLPPGQADAVVRVARSQGVEAWVAGVVEPGEKRVIVEPLGIEYGAGDLHVRC
jgi:phosphoribosylformylglycinamidine cyclo-ligase